MTKTTFLTLIIAMTFTVTIAGMSIPTFADDIEDRSQYYEEYEEPEIKGFTASSLAVDPCDSATNPSQCLYTPATSLPPYASDVLRSQSATPNEACDEVLIISSGNPNDADTDLSTNMFGTGCGANPDGYGTNDCVDVTYTPTVDSIILAYSSEYPEYQNSIFTDWMRVTGADTSIDISIDDWPAPPGTTEIPYGPQSTGTQTLGTITAGDTVDLRVADSGDSIYDTGLIVIPAACADNPQPLFCGDNIVQSALGEQCDDGNTVDGDGCSSICLLENTAPICDDATTISSIWPPNHKMVEVPIEGITDADGDTVTITIDSIEQDEPTDDLGDGNHTPDGDGVGTETAQVRAERSGIGDGRIYEISFTADDGNGGSCSGSVTVGVPHDKKSEVVDSGDRFDSTS